MIHSYKDLVVWQKALQLVKGVYLTTKKFPKEELYGLVMQMRRAAVSIISNIAEGHSRGHLLEYIQFLKIAYGSCAELEAQLLVSKELGFIEITPFNLLVKQTEEIMRMLNGLIAKLKQSKPKT